MNRILVALFLVLPACPAVADVPASPPDADRAQAIARAFGGGPREERDGRSGTVAAAAVAVVTLGLAAWAGIRQWQGYRRRREASEPHLYRGLCHVLRLRRPQARRVRSAARRLGVGHPSVLLLCPSVLRARLDELPPRERDAARLVLLRLAA